MAATLRSNELHQVLDQVHRKNMTGFVSVADQDGTRRIYGTLQVLKGRLVSAEYANLQGRAALEALRQRDGLSVFFDRSRVSAPTIVDLPSVPEYLGAAVARGARAASAAVAPSEGAGAKAGAGVFRWGIFQRVLVTMLFAALVPLAGLWAVTYINLRQNVQSSVEQTLESASALLVSQVNDWTDKNARASRQVAHAIDVATLEPNPVHPLLVAANATNPWNYSAFIVAPNGDVLARNDGANLLNYHDRQYFRQAMAGQAVGQQVVISRITNQPSLCMSVPVRNGGGPVEGIVAQCGHLDQVSGFVSDADVGSTGVVFVTDSQGQLIAHTDTSLITDELVDYSAHPALALAPGNTVTMEDADGEDVVVTTARTALGWTVVVQQDYAEAFAGLARTERNAFALLVAALILVGGVAWTLARRLVRPIQSLTAVAEGISRGDLDADIPEARRRDEIGMLAQALERLRVSVKMAFEELQRS